MSAPNQNASSKFCRLCAIQNHAVWLGEQRSCDIPFSESEHFTVFPAAGGMIAGHAIIVSRTHAASLLSMKIELRDEAINHLARLDAVWPSRLLVWEHGAGDESTGPCIVHTHLHTLPLLNEAEQLLERIELPKIQTGSLTELVCPGTPYIMLRNHLDNWTLYDASRARSQYIRCMLYQAYSLVHWDWRIASDEDLHRETLTLWQGRLM